MDELDDTFGGLALLDGEINDYCPRDDGTRRNRYEVEVTPPHNTKRTKTHTPQNQSPEVMTVMSVAKPLPASWSSASDEPFPIDEMDPNTPQITNPQDLIDRINQLTRAINSKVQTSLEASVKMIDLAKENKQLAYQAGNTLNSLVIKSCSLVGSALKTHRPGVDESIRLLRDKEARLVRAAANKINARDMALVGQRGFPGPASTRNDKEVSRLKDRVVDQDAELQESSRLVQRLMAERDTLRKKFKTITRDQQFSPSAPRKTKNYMNPSPYAADEQYSPAKKQVGDEGRDLGAASRNSEEPKYKLLSTQLQKLQGFLDDLSFQDISLASDGQEDAQRVADEEEWEFL
ncbi:hypothetical protein F4778DRAFT_777858 [Xylariomycetidae sp. FL2044]|nr:hypothetical protein F4778DRAFT_777858 [Xylariomycetidae sp. FL2044]